MKKEKGILRRCSSSIRKKTVWLLLCTFLLSMTVSATGGSLSASEEERSAICERIDTQQNTEAAGGTAPSDMTDFSDVVHSIEPLLFGLDVARIAETVTKALQAVSIKELFVLGKNLYKSVIDYALGLNDEQAMSETIGEALDAAKEAINESGTGNSETDRGEEAVFDRKKDTTDMFGAFKNLLNSLMGMLQGA